MKYSAVTLICFSVLLHTAARSAVYFSYLLNKAYISQSLCINKNKPSMHCEGKCHLKKQLQKEDKKEQSPVNPVRETNEIQFFSENKSGINLATPSVTNQLTHYYFFSLSDKHIFSVFHPPKV